MRTRLFFASALLGLVACSSDSSSSRPADGTLLSFQGSECKKEGGQPLTAQEGYAGLQCIRWQTLASGKLHVELTNFNGACGASWKGEAKKTAEGLELWLVNPECMIAACGSCMYDWTFDVNVATDADLALGMVTDPCPGQQAPEKVSASLPLSTTAEGELCRYADYGGLGWQAAALGACGQAYMPCRSANGMCSMGSSTTACEAGLTCADGPSAAEQVCHAPCTGDADCAPAGTLTCQGGLCRPAKSW